MENKRGRPKGSTTKLTKSWVYDRLVDLDFDVLKEAVGLYRTLPDTSNNSKIEIIRILSEFALPKPRPVDASGETEGAPIFNLMPLTDEQARMLASAAREEHEKESQG